MLTSADFATLGRMIVKSFLGHLAAVLLLMSMASSIEEAHFSELGFAAMTFLAGEAYLAYLRREETPTLSEVLGFRSLTVIAVVFMVGMALT